MRAVDVDLAFLVGGLENVVPTCRLRRPARGTCFRISLPVEASDRPGTDDGHRDGLTGDGVAMARETEEAGQGLGRHD